MNKIKGITSGTYLEKKIKNKINKKLQKEVILNKCKYYYDNGKKRTLIIKEEIKNKIKIATEKDFCTQNSTCDK